VIESILAILDPIVSSRCYPNILPESNTDYPALTYRIAGVQPHRTFGSPSAMDHQMLDIHIYAESAPERIAIAAQVRAALDYVRPTGIHLITFRQQTADDYLEHLGLFTNMQEYRITINE